VFLLHLPPTVDPARTFHNFSKIPNILKKIHHHQPLLPPIPAVFTYEPLTRIQGYVSPKRADYFIWELGVFEEGLKVVLGDNLVLARITGIVGVGRNFIKFGVETLGSSLKNEIPVKRMIVSFSPDVFRLSRSQRFKRSFLPWFLKSMRDLLMRTGF